MFLHTPCVQLLNQRYRTLIHAAKHGNVAAAVDLIRRYSQVFAEERSGIEQQASLLFIDAVVQTSTPTE